MKRAFLAAGLSLIVLSAWAAFANWEHEADASDIERFVPVQLASVEPDYLFTDVRKGCTLVVYDLENLRLFDLDFSERVASTFSQWLPSLDGVLYELASFDTINFDPCYRAFERRYLFSKLGPAIRNGRDGLRVRIGGLIAWSIPVSHANAMIVSIRRQGSSMLLLMAGRS